MKRKGGKYTYVPKDEIAEVRTFNDVSFENDDLLDGAYVRGRKRKFKHGGMTHKRPMSLEEQAAESVGYDTWYMMDAVDQKELVDELVSTGMIAPMYGWGGKMADGGRVLVGKFDEQQLRNKEDKKAVEKAQKETGLKYVDTKFVKKGGKMMMEVYLIPNEEYYKSSKFADGGEIEVGDTVKYKKAKYHATVIDIVDDVDIPYAKIEYPNGMIVRAYLEDLRKVELGVAEEYVNTDLMDRLKKEWDEKHKMADGGYLYLDKEEKQSAVSEAVKIAEFAYMNDISASGNSLEDFSNKIFQLSGISYAKAYLRLAYDSMKNLGFADGGEISYVVKYSMKDTPEIVKEKVFADKDAAELFHETISDDEDLVVMDLQEIKPAPAPAPKKSLFASAKPAPATTAAAKKKRERVQVDGIEDEIARYDQLKATINNAKAEQEVIGGRLKEIGREKFLELYEQRGVRPANFDLADGDQNILLEVTDKYLKVEPEKAELLRQFDGLLEEKTTYEFDSELLEKEVSEGMTIGDVISMLIQDSKLIPENDKANLIKAKMSMRVPKGTIDRLMDYDNPREVFNLISPILALK